MMEKRLKILAVDDDFINLKLISSMLKRNVNVDMIVEATNGLDALNLLKTETNIDLILLDIKMPVMDGIEAVREIIEIDPGAKVIMVTAAGQKTNMVEALKRGAADFIQKPFDSAVIINTIEKVLEDE